MSVKSIHPGQVFTLIPNTTVTDINISPIYIAVPSGKSNQKILDSVAHILQVVF